LKELGLVQRFRSRLGGEGGPGPGERVVVAVSGGLDSCVLLHLLHFEAPDALDLVVAHYDHALRADSSDDALWVRGLCRAWDVPLRTERAERAPVSEESARRARYAFLERVRTEESATFVMVGHHADDQAETVLFRVLRGTGLGGLAAIPRVRPPGVFRPLLDFWRDELEGYARSARLGWREDPSNDELGYARNAVRHELLPLAERLVAPGARRALVRLARLAEENEAAWQTELTRTLGTLGIESHAAQLSFDRSALGRSPPPMRARIVRALGQRAGQTLDEARTRAAVEFCASGRSGTGIDLGGGLVLRRELDRLVLGSRPQRGEDEPLRIGDAGPGSGHALVGGRRVRVSWGGPAADAHEHVTCLEARLPLVVRARHQGDRIRLPGGSKKLKKLFLEARIPLEARAYIPVVTDAAGDVVWIPGLARALPRPGAAETDTIKIGIG
jgi:tRNA(Ile)-lysidine synthase